MRKYIILIISVLLIGCSKNNEESENLPIDTYYKIVSFEVVNSNPIDLDNNGVSSTDIISELTNYSSYPYDLQINSKRKNGSELFSFYLPTQNIDYNNFVEFTREGFTYESKSDNFDNIEIDKDNFIISFNKTTSSGYQLVLKKKYYDFSTNSFNNFEFNIVFEKI